LNAGVGGKNWLTDSFPWGKFQLGGGKNQLANSFPGETFNRGKELAVTPVIKYPARVWTSYNKSDIVVHYKL